MKTHGKWTDSDGRTLCGRRLVRTITLNHLTREWEWTEPFVGEVMVLAGQDEDTAQLVDCGSCRRGMDRQRGYEDLVSRGW